MSIKCRERNRLMRCWLGLNEKAENLDQLGEIMGRDPEQISDWLSGRHNPFRKNRERIELFLIGLGF